MGIILGGMCVSVRTRISAWSSAARRKREAHCGGVSPSTLTQVPGKRTGMWGQVLVSCGAWGTGHPGPARDKVQSFKFIKCVCWLCIFKVTEPSSIVCVECLFLRSPSRVPYRTESRLFMFL